MLRTLLVNIAGDERHNWIGQEESTGRAEKVGNSSAHAEYWQPQRAFGEIECERCKSATRSEKQSHRKDPEVLQRQRNWSARQWHRNARTQGNEKAGGDHDGRLLGKIPSLILFLNDFPNDGPCLAHNLGLYSRHGVPSSREAMRIRPQAATNGQGCRVPLYGRPNASSAAGPACRAKAQPTRPPLY